MVKTQQILCFGILVTLNLSLYGHAECPSPFTNAIIKELSYLYRCTEVESSNVQAAHAIQQADLCLAAGLVDAKDQDNYGKEPVIVISGSLNGEDDAFGTSRIYWGNSGLPTSKYRKRTTVAQSGLSFRDGRAPSDWDFRSTYQYGDLDSTTLKFHEFRWHSEEGVSLDFVLNCKKLRTIPTL